MPRHRRPLRVRMRCRSRPAAPWPPPLGRCPPPPAPPAPTWARRPAMHATWGKACTASATWPSAARQHTAHSRKHAEPCATPHYSLQSGAVPATLRRDSQLPVREGAFCNKRKPYSSEPPAAPDRRMHPPPSTLGGSAHGLLGTHLREHGPQVVAHPLGETLLLRSTWHGAARTTKAAEAVHTVDISTIQRRKK